MKKSALLVLLMMVSAGNLWAQGEKPFKLTDAWKTKIRALAPDTTRVQPEKAHKVLLFSVFTGFDHWVIPHTDAVIEILSDQTGVCEVVQTTDVTWFTPDRLKAFDAVILNNNCSIGPKRDLIYDALKKGGLPEAQCDARAAELEKHLIDYVAAGHGLLCLHGAIVMQNNSAAFSEMMGGSFDYHPAQQPVQLDLVDPAHPLVKAFDGKPFIHVDEPYLFKNAYTKLNFRPLLSMDLSKLTPPKGKTLSGTRYVSWIKRHGQGRVMYISPSHNAQSFEQPALLQFYLDGLQYVLGDLSCDDSPIGQ
jgi:type 1 glutamine amidotransferase